MDADAYRIFTDSADLRLEAVERWRLKSAWRRAPSAGLPVVSGKDGWAPSRSRFRDRTGDAGDRVVRRFMPIYLVYVYQSLHYYY